MTGPIRWVLVPGRHHLLTRSQARYLRELLAGRVEAPDGAPIAVAEDATVVWAVLAANRSDTRANPIPGHRREAAIELFAEREGIASIVVPVFDTGAHDRLADVVLNTVADAVGDRHVVTPADTVVVCGSPAVARRYRRLGCTVVTDEPDSPRPRELLDRMAVGDRTWADHTHDSSVDVFARYGLVDRVRVLFGDDMTTEDGSLTDSRDYATYTAAIETSAQQKWSQIRDFVQPGRIVDIGCGTGALLARMAEAPELADSDLYGVELSRHLFDECLHHKSQGRFRNPSVYFRRHNVLAGPMMAAGSVDTTVSCSVTHEVYSYGGGAGALSAFAGAVAEHTAPGGVWINLDVCGPDSPNLVVDLVFHEAALARPVVRLRGLPAERVRAHLDALRPADRFDQFAADFRRNAGVRYPYVWLDDRTVRLRLADAMEYLTKYFYTDNWLSETHESFCAMTFSDWGKTVGELGLEIDPQSRSWCNEWLADRRFAPVATLRQAAGGTVLDWPSTHLLLVSRRPPAC